MRSNISYLALVGLLLDLPLTLPWFLGISASGLVTSSVSIIFLLTLICFGESFELDTSGFKKFLIIWFLGLEALLFINGKISSTALLRSTSFVVLIIYLSDVMRTQESRKAFKDVLMPALYVVIILSVFRIIASENFIFDNILNNIRPTADFPFINTYSYILVYSLLLSLSIYGWPRAVESIASVLYLFLFKNKAAIIFLALYIFALTYRSNFRFLIVLMVLFLFYLAVEPEAFYQLARYGRSGDINQNIIEKIKDGILIRYGWLFDGNSQSLITNIFSPVIFDGTYVGYAHSVVYDVTRYLGAGFVFVLLGFCILQAVRARGEAIGFLMCLTFFCMTSNALSFVHALPLGYIFATKRICYA